MISIGPSEVCANSGATLGRPLFFVILFCIFVVVNLAKCRGLEANEGANLMHNQNFKLVILSIEKHNITEIIEN